MVCPTNQPVGLLGMSKEEAIEVTRDRAGHVAECDAQGR